MEIIWASCCLDHRNAGSATHNTVLDTNTISRYSMWSSFSCKYRWHLPFTILVEMDEFWKRLSLSFFPLWSSHPCSRAALEGELCPSVCVCVQNGPFPMCSKEPVRMCANECHTKYGWVLQRTNRTRNPDGEKVRKLKPLGLSYDKDLSMAVTCSDLIK